MAAAIHMEGRPAHVGGVGTEEEDDGARNLLGPPHASQWDTVLPRPSLLGPCLSEGRGPLEFVVGAGQMIAGFDEAVVGMKLNEEKTKKNARKKAKNNNS